MAYHFAIGVRQLTDEAGQVTLARSYTPFGKLLSQSGTPQGSFGYAGEQRDAASGLIFLRARYYDPTTGRFLTRDPYPAYATAPATLHRYAYVENNPVNRMDPSGLRGVSVGRPAVPRPGARWSPLQTSGLAHVRALRAGLTSGGWRIGSPTSSASLSYRPGWSTPGVDLPSFKGFSRSGTVRFPGPAAMEQRKQQVEALNRYTQAQSAGHRPGYCGPTGAIGHFWNVIGQGRLAQGAWQWAMHEYRTNPFWRQKITAGNLRNWLQARGMLREYDPSHPGLFGEPLLRLPWWVPDLNEPLENWIEGQIDYARQAWEHRDWRMGVTMAFNFGTGLVVGGITAVNPVAGLLIAAPLATIANTTFNLAFYPSGEPFLTELGANFAGEGLETLGEVLGTAYGGPVGGFLGAVVGAGLGQMASNALLGRPLDEGLLFSVGMSAAFEATGTAVGATLGRSARVRRFLGLDVDVNAPRTRPAGDVDPSRPLLPVKWDEGTQQWQAAADFEFEGTAYREGQIVPTELGQYAPRRPGLPPRADLGWQKGQLADAEFDALRQMAIRRGEQIVLSGSLAETDVGLLNRYDPDYVLPESARWRSRRSKLVESGAGDIDLWEGSNLTPDELAEIRRVFPEDFRIDLPQEGYNLQRYPDLESFGASRHSAGALVFEPDGKVWRIPAARQGAGRLGINRPKLLEAGPPTSLADQPGKLLGPGDRYRPPTVGEPPPGMKWVDIDKLEPVHPADSRIWPEGMRQSLSRADYRAAQIRAEGFKLEHAIWTTETPGGRIIITQGHHRVEALRRLGYRQAPVQPDPTLPPSAWRAYELLADEYKGLR